MCAIRPGSKEWKADKANYPVSCVIKIPSSAEPNPFWQCEVRIQKEAQKAARLKKEKHDREMHALSVEAEKKRHEAMARYKELHKDDPNEQDMVFVGSNKS